MVNHPWEYCLDMHLHSSYMVLQTRTFNCKIISIGVILFLFQLISSHTLAWACILQFKLYIRLVSFITQPCICIFQSNLYYYIFYVCHAKIGPPKIGLARLILEDRFAKIGPPRPLLMPKLVQPDQLWQQKLVLLCQFWSPVKINLQQSSYH